MKFLNFQNKKNGGKTLGELVTREFIESAYARRSGEIESLRQHDIGEKVIVPRDLRTFLKIA